MKYGFVRLPAFLRTRVESAYYRVRCPECSHDAIVELCSAESVAEESPEETSGEECRKVSVLPKRCPVCGARVKAERVPVSIRY